MDKEKKQKVDFTEVSKDININLADAIVPEDSAATWIVSNHKQLASKIENIP